MERIRLALVATVLALVAAGCGGGSAGGGVASMSGGATTTVGAADGRATEEEVLTWVECMRGEGVDIPDPTVDADGNLTLGRIRIGAGAAGETPPSTVDRPDFEGAMETCGEPPRTGGGFSEEDRQEMQDNALKMAQCLREQGLDVADPDFSDRGPGGAPSGSAGPRTVVRGAAFDGLDLDDPAVQAAFTTCQQKLGTAFPGGGPGAGAVRAGG